MLAYNLSLLLHPDLSLDLRLEENTGNENATEFEGILSPLDEDEDQLKQVSFYPLIPTTISSL